MGKTVFSEALKSGKFVVTSEIGPPKGIDTKEILSEAEFLKGRVEAVNVTDLQSSVMKLGSLATCHLLIEKGIEPVFQITCRDRNRLALQSDILSGYVLGIRNLLILTGDHPKLGDDPRAKPVFDLDSVQLLEAVKKLQEGEDMAGNKLEGEPPKFFVGAVVNPGAEPIEPQIIKMEKKINAGAQFFQTQAVYEPDKFARFMEKVKGFGVPVLAGIVLLKSAGMARYMNKNVSGVHVPESMIEEMEKVEKEKRGEKSVEIAARIIMELKGLCQGVHIMPLGWGDKVPKVMELVFQKENGVSSIFDSLK
ncbi:methylenetetrahydrofolate reductase [bacterium]|nr:methylenetetrahydrofolate reductase [bacterium]